MPSESVAAPRPAVCFQQKLGPKSNRTIWIFSRYRSVDGALIFSLCFQIRSRVIPLALNIPQRGCFECRSATTISMLALVCDICLDICLLCSNGMALVTCAEREGLFFLPFVIRPVLRYRLSANSMGLLGSLQERLIREESEDTKDRENRKTETKEDRRY